MTEPKPVDIRSEAFSNLMADYPYASDVDALEELPLKLLTADDNAAELFQARVLGWGTSYRDSHYNHAPGTPPKGRCSGCRWTDTAILWAQPVEYEPGTGFRPIAQWQYVYVSLGKSQVHGEMQRDTIVWTDDPEVVLRSLFVPTKPGFRRDKGQVSIPRHNAAAFRDAACIDAAIGRLLDQYEPVIPELDRSGPDDDPLAGLYQL